MHKYKKQNQNNIKGWKKEYHIIYNSFFSNDKKIPILVEKKKKINRATITSNVSIIKIVHLDLVRDGPFSLLWNSFGPASSPANFTANGKSARF